MGLDTITNFFAGIPTDWLIIGSFALLSALDAVRAGSRRVCLLALALPATVILVDSLPDAAILGSIAAQFSTPILGAVFFFLVLVIVYIIIGRIGLAWGGEAGQTIQAALSGVAIAALAVTFWIQVPVLDSIWHFGPQVQDIFGESYRFFWLLGSYAALAFVRNS